MKNIHILPTDKPSRLCYVTCTEKTTLTFFEDEMQKDKRFFPQHIFISNDEEIKEGDWYWLEKIGRIGSERGAYKSSSVKASKLNTLASNCKKIILTTDQDLIKDGAQSIDDEFLEWFVKNPSCEEVEIKLVNFEVDMGLGESCVEYGSYYKIIIPKEEPNYNMKQEILAEMEKLEQEQECEKCFDTGEDQMNDIGYEKCTNCNGKGKEPKQETLEEAARIYAKLHPTKDIDEEERYYNSSCKDYDSFKAGAKWQAERMYSEEEVISIYNEWLKFDDAQDSYNGQDDLTFVQWLEQFKKK